MKPAIHSLFETNFDLVDLLHDFRPHWLEGQECGLFFPNDVRPFRSHLQPYIMRMSCHEALPNLNMLP